jgi:hypothetical protein
VELSPPCSSGEPNSRPGFCVVCSSVHPRFVSKSGSSTQQVLARSCHRRLWVLNTELSCGGIGSISLVFTNNYARKQRKWVWLCHSDSYFRGLSWFIYSTVSCNGSDSTHSSNKQVLAGTLHAVRYCCPPVTSFSVFTPRVSE